MSRAQSRSLINGLKRISFFLLSFGNSFAFLVGNNWENFWASFLPTRSN